MYNILTVSKIWNPFRISKINYLNISRHLQKMCDYEEEEIVPCPYNKFQMCLLGRMTKHMWKCHPKEYNRDRDIWQQDLNINRHFVN
jgi:hypothetical protein